MKWLVNILLLGVLVAGVSACQQLAEAVALTAEGVQQVCDAVAPRIEEDSKPSDSLLNSQEQILLQDPICSDLA